MVESGGSSSAVTKRPHFFYGYVVVLVSFFLMMLMLGTFYTYGVFFNPLSTEFGWTRAMTSGAYSLAFFLSGLLGIVMGRLNDKFGPRVVMMLCGFLLGLGYLLMSQVSAVWQLYLFLGVIVGIGMSGNFVPIVSTVARWFVRRRGIMTGFVVTGVGIGTMIIPPGASGLISNCGWSIAYIVIGIVALVLIVLGAQFLKREPGQMGLVPYGENEVGDEGLNSPARGFSLQEAIGTWQFWMFFSMVFCFGFCQMTIMVHIVPHVTGLGISAAIAASVLSVIGGSSILGRIVMGTLADRMGGRPPFIIAFIIMSCALFWLLVAKELWMLYLFALMFGFPYGAMIALQSPMVAELFGLSSHGIILGVAAFGFTVGGSVGPVLAGRIFDIIGSYRAGFLVCAILAVVGFILASLIRPSSREGGGE